MATLRLAKLTKRFGTVVAVDEADLDVGHGELVCLLGPSGCGKSTALRMIGGLEESTSGQVVIDGEVSNHLPPNRRPTAMVFQKYTLWPHMTVFKNIAFGLQLRKLSADVVRAKVSESLSLVGLDGYANRYPGQLSGGQQQRVAIARALVLEPKILLMDEPFSSLDAHLRVRLRDELKHIQRRLQITTIFVTHDQEEALSLADRIAIMNSGRIEQFASPDEIYANPASLFAAGFIGSMTITPGVVTGGTLRLGEHPVRLPAPGLADGPVQVAVRPEDAVAVRASEAQAPVAGETQHLGATIERIINLGPSYMLHLDVPGVGHLKVSAHRTMRPIEGEAVQVELRRYLVYPDDGGAVVEVVAPSSTGAQNGISNSLE